MTSFNLNECLKALCPHGHAGGSSFNILIWGPQFSLLHTIWEEKVTRRPEAARECGHAGPGS